VLQDKSQCLLFAKIFMHFWDTAIFVWGHFFCLTLYMVTC